MIDEIVQVDDDGRLFLSGAIADWKPVHARRITIAIDLVAARGIRATRSSAKRSHPEVTFASS